MPFETPNNENAEHVDTVEVLFDDTGKAVCYLDNRQAWNIGDINDQSCSDDTLGFGN